MTRGLLAPLSPPEEIALRRIAHGSVVFDAQVAARLASLALVERVNTSLRLTPLGRLRFNALPTAPLLARRTSIQTASDYVEGVIEKAQGMAKRQAPKPSPSPPAQKPAPPVATTDDDDDQDDGARRQLIFSFSDLAHWQSRAESNIEKTRRIMIEHRHHQERRCDDSRRRIALSRSLLATTAPVTPAWVGALQAPEN